MHMSDALLSPAVGGAFWAASVGALAVASRAVARQPDDGRVALMGVLGAFVFAAQMLNFAIPGTGASGHLAGSTLLAILLGPHAGFLVIASVLCVQALLFADGGLLALGANVFNLGVLPCYLVYPLLYRPLAALSAGRHGASAAFVTAVVALQAGAFGVVAQTSLSGVAALPFAAFLTLMQPIHLVIGLAEGAATLAVLGYLARVQSPAPDLQPASAASAARAPLLAAVCIGCALAWFASSAPDGLEWAVEAITQGDRPPADPASGMHAGAAALQERTALMPDYALPPASGGASATGSSAATAVAGLIGGALSLALAGALGWLLRRR